MSNLIKMELYKLRTSKLFIILLSIFAVVNIVSSFGTSMLVNAIVKNPEAIKGDLSSMFVSPFVLEMLMLFTFVSLVSFLYLDFNNGYIKNLAGQVPNRGYIVFSKFIAVAVHNLIYFLVAVLTCFISGLITGINMDIQNLGAGIATFFIKWLLSLGIGAILMFFAVGLKSKSFALILGVMIPVGAFSLIYMGIDTAVKNFLKIKGFALGNFMPDSLIGSVNAVKGTLLANGIISAVVCIVLFYILTYITFNKRDIK